MTTTTTSTPNAIAMGNGNKKGIANSLSVGDIDKHPSKSVDKKDVTKWSSIEVHQWIKEQCKRFELRKATVEKFEMNGQALALLTKHDFLRRSPDGGEILYYALQKLINPNKGDSARHDQNGHKNGVRSPLIVELGPDEDSNDTPDPSSPKPIIEEPDDPPKIHRSQSDAYDYIPPPVLTMPVGAAAAFFHQHHQQQQRRQGIPEEFIQAHQQQQHMHPGPMFYQPGVQHYHPMMSAQGILIEAMDDIDPSSFSADGVNGTSDTNGTDGTNGNAQEAYYMVTMNGQRFVMNEAQVRQLVTEVYQQQAYQENLQQQQHFHQQQQFFQQQQHFQQQQQQRFQQQQQQQQQQRFQQQPQPPRPQHPFPDSRPQFRPQRSSFPNQPRQQATPPIPPQQQRF
ncbi:hypothetical protein I4U23_020684 [Adineta vaga]|nr:hypothetical protein I4U23_020684 [Adineta vaga]